MPRYTRPANSPYAEDPIKALGNMVQAGIIGHLRQHPNETRSEIADALETPKATINHALERLLGAGLLLADPPRDQATRGQWIRYRVDDAAVSEMYLQLGLALGEM